MPAPKPVVLCILDGWGLREERENNAVALANTPNFDRIMAAFPNTTLTAHGPDVGLPEGQMGNSEVGHTNIGAGRVVWMDLPKINNAITDGSFQNNAALLRFAENLKNTGGTAHVAGLASPGGVHAHQDHIVEIAKVLTGAGVPVVLHAYLDGRDVAPKSADKQIAKLVNDLPPGAKIGTVCGRFFAMDRDNRWDRVQAAFDVMTTGKGTVADTANDAIIAAYEVGETDEFASPTAIDGYTGMQNDDGLLFVNFRADRAREILSALADPKFDVFDVSARPKFSAICGMVEYSNKHNAYMDVMFPSEEIVNTLGHWVSSHGKTQYRLAETEKYPHVTFFMNGGEENPETGEDRYVAPSPRVKTYDMQPEMSAAEVTDHLVDAISGQVYDLIIVNFANPDMVGHTGDLQAAMQACEAVDEGVGKALAALKNVNGAMILTADHGNCETMVDPETGEPHTAHTLNPVPVVLIGGPEGAKIRSGGRLGDLAPSLLQLMELPIPKEMTGQSLIV
ncbi:phosphoglycerate mutase (2,3-diphosphoglycerate-independent) [Rhodobacterales bacterium 52_120_T64]|nr:phosphoglycerate mutase (2,3-diphosphoglycerate-independent) [Rhodobacterales bacterium 52_120_T64]